MPTTTTTPPTTTTTNSINSTVTTDAITHNVITNYDDYESPIIFYLDIHFLFSERHSNSNFEPNGRDSGLR